MREVFIRQPFFPRILNQTLRPVRISFLNQCMMNIGITTAAWEMAQGTSDTSPLRYAILAGLLV